MTLLPTIRDCAHHICVERPIGFQPGRGIQWEDLPCPVCAFVQGIPDVAGPGDPRRRFIPIRAFGPSPRGRFERGCWFYTYRVEYR